MTGLASVTFILAASVLGQASAPPLPNYTPAVPNGSTYNGYGGYGYGGTPGGATVAGSAMQGMASVISARGDYNLSTSAAAINLTVAERNQIQNRQMATDAYFQMRAANRAYQAAERGPLPTEEELARFAAEGAPKPVSSNQMNPVTGQIFWPELLQADLFANQRKALEPLLARKAQYGSLGVTDMVKAGDLIDSMSSDLHGQIRSVPPALYMESKNFLKSLMYSVTKTQL